tara:strand:- start:249 stop:485 length:237 start_codon:yes stop_codon:yes gene_type:complete
MSKPTVNIQRTKYPFSEGTDYYTIDHSGRVTRSVWDDTSEEIHDENPSQLYYFVMGDGLLYFKWQSANNVYKYQQVDF